MLLGEPASTQFDLHFRIFSIPVRVHPFFWAVSVLFAISAQRDLKQTLVWAGVVFVSILVHEFGHAFMVIFFGGRPWVTLYGFGGLCSYQPLRREAWSSILISAAGPGAGFLLLGLVLAAVRAAGHGIWIEHSGDIPEIKFDLFQSYELNLVIYDLIWVNLFWGLLNLVPLYPLDGGQISRELFMLGNPRDGVKQSLWLSMITGGGIALLAFTRLHQPYLGLLFGYLVYTNWQTLQAYSGRGGFGGGFGGRGW